MSYILDALKKSERQRPPGTVPDLFTVHGPQPPSSRRSVRAIVVAALLLVVPAFILWVWIGAGRDEGDARPQVAASPQPPAPAPAPIPAPAPPVTPRTVATPQPQAPERAATAAAAPPRAAAMAHRSVDEQSQTPAPPAQKSRGVVASSVVSKAISAAPPAQSAPRRISAPAAPISLPPAPSTTEPAVISPQAGGEAPSVPVVSASEETPPADGRVLDLAELPASLRAELPKLLVSGHVWSEEPELRLLSVDDRLLREGGEAAPGVNLQEITPAGAVFVYRGWHFRVAGGRP